MVAGRAWHQFNTKNMSLRIYGKPYTYSEKGPRCRIYKKGGGLYLTDYNYHIKLPCFEVIPPSWTLYSKPRCERVSFFRCFLHIGYVFLCFSIQSGLKGNKVSIWYMYIVFCIVLYYVCWCICGVYVWYVIYCILVL